MELDFNKILNSVDSKNLNFDKGEMVYSGEEELGEVYFLSSGKIKIESRIKKTNKPILLWLMVSDSFFGITSFFSRNSLYAYKCSVVSESACIKIIPRESFTSLIITNTEFREFIFKLLYRRLDYIDNRKSYNSKVTLRKKVADDLIFFGSFQQKNIDLKESQVRCTYLSASDLAEMNKTNKKGVNAVLEEFENKKLIGRIGEQVLIKNHERLSRIV